MKTALPTRRRALAAAALLPWLPARAQAPLPHVASGRLERLADFPSRHVDARHVDVWLPAGYDTGVRHDVLYMHDGQMLFDATTTWNRQAWDLPATLGPLIAARRVRPTIVVAVWNNGPRRHAEYYPQGFLPHLPAAVRQAFVERALQGTPRSDAYLRFLVEELKPAIDARFATEPGRDHTHVMGSSMGGLISLYAYTEHPQVFGGAASLSTHWIGSFEPNALLPLAALIHLRDRLGPPDGRRLYLDTGTVELDALYPTWHAAAAQVVRDRGYVEDRDTMLRVFDGAGHNERAWAARLAVPLQFLLGPR